MTEPQRLTARPETDASDIGVIALFIPDFTVGGGERITIILARGLAELGFEVDLVVANAQGALRSEVPEGVRIVDLGVSRMRWALPGLVRYLRRRRPAWIAPTIEDANVVAIIAAKLAGRHTRVMLRIANTLSVMATRSSSLPTRLTFLGVRKLYRRADVLIACSQGVADDMFTYANVPRSATRVIYQAAVNPDLPELARAPLDHPWFAGGGPPVIIGVGRLVEQKNFALLVDAFARLRRTHDARLAILGDGPLREELESQIHHLGLTEDVDVAGWDTNPYRHVARSQLFVLSSRFEGLPGVLIEALACGVPVVATDCPSGPREILQDGKYGALVPMDEPEALAEAMRLSLDDPQPPPPAAWRPFTQEQVAREYDALLRELG